MSAARTAVRVVRWISDLPIKAADPLARVANALTNLRNAGVLILLADAALPRTIQEHPRFSKQIQCDAHRAGARFAGIVLHAWICAFSVHKKAPFPGESCATILDDVLGGSGNPVRAYSDDGFHMGRRWQSSHRDPLALWRDACRQRSWFAGLLQESTFWFVRFLVTAIAGALAVAEEATKPLLAINIGASAPAILQLLTKPPSR